MQFVRLASFFHVAGINCKPICTFFPFNQSFSVNQWDIIDDKYRKNHHNLAMIDLFHNIGAKNESTPSFLLEERKNHLLLPFIFRPKSLV